MKHVLLRHLFAPLTVLTVILSLGGCSTGNVGCNYRAAVTIEPLRYFVNELAGPRWQVSTVVPRGFSPEEFMPTVKQMADVAEACCLFKVGSLGFETTMLADDVVAELGLRVCDTSEGLGGSASDPHTWTSPANAKTICRNISRTLAELDPANSQEYETRLERMELRIDSLHLELTEILKELPSRAFVIAHPALTQFAADYHLHQIAIESGGKEPVPGSVRNLISQARKEGVRVIFVQQEFAESTALVIARQTGARIVRINPLAYDWRNQLLLVARTLKDKEETDATAD